jgi:hypothetical protein
MSVLLVSAVVVGAGAYRLGVDAIWRRAEVEAPPAPIPGPPADVPASEVESGAGPETTSEPTVAMSESEAIERALTLLPEGTVPTETVARLVSNATLSWWTGASEEGEDPASECWVVGMRAPGLTQSDASMVFGGDIDSPTGSEPIDAVAVVFDRRTGDLKSVGSLASGQTRTYDGLLALPTVSAEP